MKETIDKLVQFRDDRNWKQFHTPKDLAISISLEANELLENFQWISSEEAVQKNMENIKDEIADVVIYSLLMCDVLGIDIEEAINAKVIKNAKKYPVGEAFGSNK